MNFKKLFDYSVPLVAATTLLIVGLCAITLYVSKVVYDIKLANDTVEVTGSAKEEVIADAARWSITLETKTDLNDQQSGFERLESAAQVIVQYLDSQGISDVEDPPATTYPLFIYPQNGVPEQTGFSVSRTITMRSSDIEKMGMLANNVEPFTGTNYNVTTGMLEYTYTKLPEMRVKLLTEAIADATNRANAIAQDSGRTVGILRNASGGVVQVLPRGGVEISDYGSYDTMSVDKEIMVTVRASFSLK